MSTFSAARQSSLVAEPRRNVLRMAIVTPFSYNQSNRRGCAVNRILFVLFFAVAGCFAQSTSSISGSVTDSSGAVIPGVAVTVMNEDTGVVNRQTTTASGLFSFPALPVGAYTLTAELKGFKSERRTRNVLVVNTPLTVDISLEVGSATEVITVEASAE